MLSFYIQNHLRKDRDWETGNKVLSTVCSYCPYKHKCWGDNIEYLPQQQSKARNPKYYWYAEVNNPKEIISA